MSGEVREATRTPETDSKGSSGSSPPPPRRPRPQITLNIPSAQRPPPPIPTTPGTNFYATSPMTPVGTTTHDGRNFPGMIPFNVFQAYPSKATEFMFKQYEGFKGFTKSGLSVGEKVSFWLYGKVTSLSKKWFTHFFLVFVIAGYSLLGGLLFRYIEGGRETRMILDLESDRGQLVKELRQLFAEIGPFEGMEDERRWEGQAAKALRGYETKLKEFFKVDANIIDKGKGDKKDWDFWSSVFYCGTIFTTIGYGHIAPSTVTGRALTIVYAIFGIPMFLILLADFGKMFTRGIKWGWAFVRRLYYTGSCKKVRKTVPVQEVMKGVQVVYDMATFRRPSQAPDPTGVEAEEPGSGEPPSTPAPSNFAIDDEFNLPITVAIVILVIYIMFGAAVFWVWEDWSFFESFYFVFISMSTIGLGDLVPKHKMYMMASMVYLAFGLALTSMCINVVQEKLSDTFRQATAKIGATIGLTTISGEDGTITPATPANVELAQVHKPSSV